MGQSGGWRRRVLGTGRIKTCRGRMHVDESSQGKCEEEGEEEGEGWEKSRFFLIVKDFFGKGGVLYETPLLATKQYDLAID